MRIFFEIEHIRNVLIAVNVPDNERPGWFANEGFNPGINLNSLSDAVSILRPYAAGKQREAYDSLDKLIGRLEQNPQWVESREKRRE